MRVAVLAVLLVVAALAAGCLGAGDEADPGSADPSSSNGSSANTPSEGRNGTSSPDREPSTNRSSEPTSGEATDNGSGTQEETGTTLRFADPVQVNGERPAFEPSIAVGPSGTVYVTAARFRGHGTPGPYSPGTNDAVGSSPVWFSTDEGASWDRMPSPGNAHRLLPGLEGDLAVDGAGGVYFVDTVVADNTFTRWSSSEGEPQWETTRPIQGTTAYLDDRPWLAAHGDGVAYYLGNTVYRDSQSPKVTRAQPGEPVWFHASEDAGRTWSPGRSFQDSVYCTPAASPTDVGAVHVGCMTIPFNEMPRAVLYTSTDMGESWDRTRLFTYKGFELPQSSWPVSAAADEGGNAYVAGADDDLEDDEPGALRVGVAPAEGSVRALNVTPFKGSYANAWAAGGPEGMLAVTFHATRDVAADEESRWYPYALVTDEADEPDPSFHLDRLDDIPGSNGTDPPEDFFQADVGPDGRVHVVFHRNVAEEPNPGGPVLYARQLAGPNLGPGS